MKHPVVVARRIEDPSCQSLSTAIAPPARGSSTGAMLGPTHLGIHPSAPSSNTLPARKMQVSSPRGCVAVYVDDGTERLHIREREMQWLAVHLAAAHRPKRMFEWQISCPKNGTVSSRRTCYMLWISFVNTLVSALNRESLVRKEPRSAYHFQRGGHGHLGR